MLTLGTPRLLFATTPVAVMRDRLAGADFLADVPAGPRGTTTETCRLRVRFPEEWPGEDALTMLPLWIAQRERQGDPGPWSDGVVIRHEDLLAVGSMGFKAAPDTTGTVEIGYAINRSERGRGYATEMAGALVAWALAQPGVRRVTAECLARNAASARVLEKLRFDRIGRRSSREGELLLWERRGSDPEPSRADVDAARTQGDAPAGPGPAAGLGEASAARIP